MGSIKCVALLSGGLDSQLAVRVIQDQGIEVHGVTYLAPFHREPAPGERSSAEVAAENLGIPLTILRESKEFMSILENPAHGYGKNMNPCIDCHTFMIRRAGELMHEIGAKFVITGEVLGQRPMSQLRGPLRVVEKGSGMEGYLLRPLSAKLLPETIPEKEGWVDRAKLLDIQGRSRKPQMALAEHYDLRDYPHPAGGCLATDPEFSNRIRDLLDHGSDSLEEMALLQHGRHFRLDEGTKAVIGRDHQDNLRIQDLAQPGDLLLELRDMPGPLGLLRGACTPAHARIAASLVARYSKAQNLPAAAVTVRTHGLAADASVLEVAPATQEDIDRLIVRKVRA